LRTEHFNALSTLEHTGEDRYFCPLPFFINLPFKTLEM